MIPLRDNIPTRRFPVVTTGLIMANVVVFLADWATQQQAVVGTAVDRYGNLVRLVDSVGGISAHYSMIPRAVTTHLTDAWPTIFISMFLHSNWLHIGGNMLYLWIFGNNVEDTLGRGRYLLFYLGCGVIAAACHVATNPQSSTPVIGASGAVAGLMGAYLVLFPHADILTIVPIGFAWILELPAVLVIGFWAVLQFLNANLLGGGSMRGGGVAYMAHVGGFLAGVLLILLLGGRRLLEQKGRADYGEWIR